MICGLLCAAQAAAGSFSGRISVVDGDTLDVGDIRVRLYGIDAPEIGQTCTTVETDWDCGRWARSGFIGRFQNHVATCKSVTTDRYSRVVARCFVDGGDIAAQLVTDGLAGAYRRYATDYVSQEKAASIAGIGIWQGQMQTPSEFRASLAPSKKTVPIFCNIKGNISRVGKIYHLPGQEHYGRTRISPRNGERWFCTEAVARAAGWRKAQR